MIKDKAAAIDHIKNHVDGYPATKEDLVKACQGMSEFAEDEKTWFADTLPDKTYNSPDEVIAALGWKETAASDQTEDDMLMGAN